MVNPWELIDLDAYETHMRTALQLQALCIITREQLAYRAASVAILGAAGGNGLEHVDPDVTAEVWAVDINEAYLAACRARFPQLCGALRTLRCDLAAPGAVLPACGLLICNLIVEYIGVPAFAALIDANRENLGIISCVIQKNNGDTFVSRSEAAERLQCLDALHRDIDEAELTDAMCDIGFRTIYRQAYALPCAKELIRIDFRKDETPAMREHKTQSKPWDWEIGAAPQWLTPSEESHWLAARWKDAGYLSMLDLGCGLGRHSIFFARHGFRVNALDLSEQGVRHLDEWKAREGLGIQTTVCDMLRLPYADGAFDCVFAYHVISHTDTLGFRRILDEIDRVLSPGGEFFVTLCSKESWSFCGAGYPRIDDSSVLKTEGAEKDVPHFYVSLDDVIALFGRFDILKIRHTDDCWFDGQKHNSKHFFILGKKKAGQTGPEVSH